MRGWNHIKSDAKGKPKKKPSKYNAVAVTIDDTYFHSTKEGDCYKLLRDSGLEYELQAKYELQPAFRDKATGEAIQDITYAADFVIPFNEDEPFIIDVKGTKTEAFKRTEKIMRYQGHRIINVPNENAMLIAIQHIKQGGTPLELYMLLKPKKKKRKKKS